MAAVDWVWVVDHWECCVVDNGFPFEFCLGSGRYGMWIILCFGCNLWKSWCSTILHWASMHWIFFVSAACCWHYWVNARLIQSLKWLKRMCPHCGLWRMGECLAVSCKICRWLNGSIKVGESVGVMSVVVPENGFNVMASVGIRCIIWLMVLVAHILSWARDSQEDRLCGAVGSIVWFEWLELLLAMLLNVLCWLGADVAVCSVASVRTWWLGLASWWVVCVVDINRLLDCCALHRRSLRVCILSMMAKALSLMVLSMVDIMLMEVCSERHDRIFVFCVSGGVVWTVLHGSHDVDHGVVDVHAFGQ